MIVYGGQNDCTSSQTVFSDIWVLSNANGLGGTPTWTQLLPAGGPPNSKTVHTAIYDSVNNRMAVFGGYSDSFGTPTNAVWVLSSFG